VELEKDTILRRFARASSYAAAGASRLRSRMHHRGTTAAWTLPDS